MIFRILCLFFLFQFAKSGVTDKDLQPYITSSAKKEVTWKEWMKSNPPPPAGAKPTPAPCSGNPSNQGYKKCCKSTSNCDKSKNLICFKGICTCKPDYFPNQQDTACELRAKKGLGQQCAPKDNCNDAFAACISGKCACKDGFVKKNNLCQPAAYDCPYKTPVTSSVGGLWPCRLGQPSSDCPRNTWCVEMVGQDRPKFITSFTYSAQNLQTGKQETIKEEYERSYCCPPVPFFVLPTLSPKRDRKRVFADVCLYGKPLASGSSCPAATHYVSPGIGTGSVCCPLPCLPHPTGYPIIRDGKCTYPAA